MRMLFSVDIRPSINRGEILHRCLSRYLFYRTGLILSKRSDYTLTTSPHVYLSTKLVLYID